MGTALKSRSSRPWLKAPTAAELADIDLIDDDGEPMESDWHVKAMGLLLAYIDQHFHDRDDYYVAGNMFIYFSAEQARNKDFRGPDFYFVWNTRRLPPRKYWVVWDEGFRTPNVVIELCSATTRWQDHGVKKDIYEQTLRVNDYFCFDPDKQLFEGWRLKRGKYVPLKPNAQGRLWSAELGLWVGPWHGMFGRYEETWLRFFDKDGRLVPIGEEIAKGRAETERRRAEAAEAEVAALREKLASSGGKSNGANDHGKRKKK